MAPTNATAGFGTLLKRGDGATPTEAFATVAEVFEVTPPGTTLETADATHMESDDAFREKIATLLEQGAVQAGVNLIAADTSHEAIRSDQLARTKRNWEIHTPSGTHKWSGPAFVTGYQPSTPLDDKMTAAIELTPAGKWTFGTV